MTKITKKQLKFEIKEQEKRILDIERRYLRLLQTVNQLNDMVLGKNRNELGENDTEGAEPESGTMPKDCTEEIIFEQVDNPEKKIVFDLYISQNGRVLEANCIPSEYKIIKQLCKIGANRYIFSANDNEQHDPEMLIGHYED